MCYVFYIYIYIYTIQAPSVSFSRRGVYRREGGEKGIAGAPAVWALQRGFLHSHHAGWMDAERERERFCGGEDGLSRVRV